MSHTRRTFLQGATAATSTLLAANAFGILQAADLPSRRVNLAVMGTKGRGTDLATTFARLEGVQVGFVCDVDHRQMEACAAAIAKTGAPAPQQVKDFRKLLDDPTVDALVIAAPNHWHAPAAILALNAGKNVYVEKPCCHTPYEGELLIQAAAKANKVLQHGTQRRSFPGIIEAIERIHAGEIGRVLFSRGWYNNARPTIGNGVAAPVPEWLDYSLWQGPAPEMPFLDNRIHYNWHWFWHWGNGELGNNGIHSLDVCRWGLQVDTPTKVSSGGGKYMYPTDDQQTPDTHVVTYDFGGKSIVWEGRSWSRKGFEGNTFGISFYGDKGSVVIDGGKYTILDPKDKVLATGGDSASQTPHLQNFIDSVRGTAKPNANAQTAVDSVMLCHYGNMAHRTGKTLNIDPKTKHVDAPDAQALWKREYREGWEPKV